jgi:hypothetical protein
MTRYSKTHSRCDCGHKIIMVDGKWQHAEPHPAHACSCMDPKPSDNIGMFRARGSVKVRAGISTLHGASCLRYESEMGL